MEETEMMEIGSDIPTRRQPTVGSRLHFKDLKRLRYEDGLFFFWYYHVLIAFLLFSLIMTAILLEGCQEHMRIGPHIYLISFSYAPDSSPSNVTVPFSNQTIHLSNTSKILDLQVRTGYFGTCISFGQDSLFGGSRATLRSRVDKVVDPLDLITLAYHFSSQSVSPIIPIMSAVVTALPLLGLMILPWKWDEALSTPRRTLFDHCCVALVVVWFFSFSSAVWQSVSTSASTSMTELATHNYARAEVGIVAEALSWGIFASRGLGGLGLLLALLAKSDHRWGGAGGATSDWSSSS